MELYRSARLQSQFRAYDYFKEKRVLSFQKVEGSIYHGKVKGNNKIYDVTIDIEHPKKSSHCNCPHAEGTKIICKHMVTLYFEIFPEKAKQFLEEIDEHNRAVEEYEQELEIKMRKHIKSMSKKELEEALLECLLQVDWLYDNFIRDRVGY
ncbi:MAG: SWIM zinc finger family protein [Firmicutes bacterium]|nr:SWIM zinc finger family protein [Bacillota bacterium]